MLVSRNYQSYIDPQGNTFIACNTGSGKAIAVGIVNGNINF